METQTGGMPVLLNMGSKTNKELAYLYELFVATDWGERFAELIDEHVNLPKKARFCTSAPAPAATPSRFRNTPTINLEFVCVEENEEYNRTSASESDALEDAVRVSRGSSRPARLSPTTTLIW